jgi:DNA-binding transcriptional LysR family regulator
MDLRHLRHFLAVVETGSFSAAAERVYVSQPALTRSIQQLERAIGAPLLVRGARRTIPTAEGRSFILHARQILQDCVEAEADVRVVQEGRLGAVSFGIDAMFAAPFLDVALVESTRDAPEIAIRVVEGAVGTLARAVEEGKLDFAIACPEAAAALPGELAFEPMLEVRSVAVLGRGHPLARRRRAEPGDLAGFDWVVLDDPSCIELWRRVSEERGIPGFRALRTNSLTLIRDQVMHARAIGLLPEPAARRELRHRLMQLLPQGLRLAGAPTAAGLLRRHREPMSAAARRVLDIIRKAGLRSVVR